MLRDKSKKPRENVMKTLVTAMKRQEIVKVRKLLVICNFNLFSILVDFFSDEKTKEETDEKNNEADDNEAAKEKSDESEDEEFEILGEEARMKLDSSAAQS